jgi:hypothetical protein
MTNEIQDRLLAAVYACLLPLARLLLRSGITYRQFDSIAKRAFVREAVAESDSRGRAVNISRIAVRTGLSRKEAKRVRDTLDDVLGAADLATADHWGPPARVLHAWHVDGRFTDHNGEPRKLPFQDDEISFAALVRAVAGDIPPGAIRAELKRCGAVAEGADGSIVALKRYYVPGDVGEKAVAVVSRVLFPVIAGIAHNANPARTVGGFIQRFAYSDRLPLSAAIEFRQWARHRGSEFLEIVDDWLAAHESRDDGRASPDQSRTFGMGVFYYEGPPAEESFLNDPGGRDMD